jgi:hypothetical protein
MRDRLRGLRRRIHGFERDTVGLERFLEQSNPRTQVRDLLVKTTASVRVHRRSLYSTVEGISSNTVAVI